MSTHRPPPLASLPIPKERDRNLERFRRLFGDRRLSQYQRHQWLLENGPQWFVFVDLHDAKCFTRWVKVVKPVKNPRSITGIQKYIAAAKNSGVIF